MHNQTITIISGTNRANSVSLQVAKIYLGLLKKRGFDAQIIDLSGLPYDFTQSALYDNEGENEQFNHFREIMANSDKFVFIVPEYNGSFPGVLKAFIDGLKFPQTFRDKKGALVGVSAGVLGANLALSHLTDIFNYCGMNILALKPKLSGIDKVLEEDRINNVLYMELLEDQVDKILGF